MLCYSFWLWDRVKGADYTKSTLFILIKIKLKFKVFKSYFMLHNLNWSAFFWDFHASISNNVPFVLRTDVDCTEPPRFHLPPRPLVPIGKEIQHHRCHDNGVHQASKIHHWFGRWRKGQRESTLTVAGTPQTDANRVVGLHICVVLCVHQTSYRMASLYMNSFPLSSCVICINFFLISISSIHLPTYIFTHAHINPALWPSPPSPPQTVLPPWRAAASLFLDEGWWRCMSGGIDNIYGAEWEWSIFLSGAVTSLAKLHHGQLPQQTPSFLVLLGAGPHLRRYTDILDTTQPGEEVQP